MDGPPRYFRDDSRATGRTTRLVELLVAWSQECVAPKTGVIIAYSQQEAVRILRLALDEAIFRGLDATMGRFDDAAMLGRFVTIRAMSAEAVPPGQRPDAVAFDHGSLEVLRRHFCDRHFGRPDIFGQST